MGQVPSVASSYSLAIVLVSSTNLSVFGYMSLRLQVRQLGWARGSLIQDGNISTQTWSERKFPEPLRFARSPLSGLRQCLKEERSLGMHWTRVLSQFLHSGRLSSHLTFLDRHVKLQKRVQYCTSAGGPHWFGVALTTLQNGRKAIRP